MSVEYDPVLERQHNPEIGLREDFITWAAECLNGEMRTPTHFQYDSESKEIYAQDGSPLEKIFKDSLVDARQLVRNNPQLKFEERRRALEYEEYKEMLEMMQDPSKPNTMIVVSDFPPELMEYPKDVGGYNVTRKQTMLRVIQRNSDGTLSMITQSLDGSNRKALESIYSRFDRVAESGELLGQRIKVDSMNTSEEIAELITQQYDNELQKQTGKIHRAGIKTKNSYSLDTYKFASSQHDLIEYYAKSVIENNDYQTNYNVAATFAARYEKALEGEKRYYPPIADNPVSRQLQRHWLEQELHTYGRSASIQGKTFSGCGSTLKPNTDNIFSAESVLSENGYGNKTDEKESYGFDSFQYCVVCQAPPDKNEKKKMCGPCGLCRTCDKNAGGKG